VREGSRSLLTAANIALASSPGDDVQDGDDNVIFLVLVAPSHGKLLLTREGGRRPHDGPAVTFTLADIKDARVVYDHDGSEATSDSFGLELQLSAVGGDRRTYSFSVVVQVASWNDRPSLSLPPNDTLTVIAGTDPG